MTTNRDQLDVALQHIAQNDGVDNMISLISGFLDQRKITAEDFRAYVRMIDTAMESSFIERWSEKQKLQYQAYLESWE